MLKLTIELVPQSCHYKNLRSELSKTKWDKLRKECYKKANYKCEICGKKGNRHPVECHEIWDYNDEEKIQRLEGLIALCPKCHEVKHIGLAEMRGNFDRALNHFMKTNDLQREDALLYIEAISEIFYERSRYNWETDISIIDSLLEECEK